jgi:uncharacterized protein (TIGR00251 family)
VTDDGLDLRARDGVLRVSVRVKPRASKDAILGVREGALEVSVRAPPVDGAANAAVLELFAKSLGVSRRSVRLVAGESSRDKIIALEGVSEAQLRALVAR